VALEGSDLLSLQRIPHVAVEVVVAGEEVSSADGERDGGDTAQNVVVRVLHDLAMSANVKETARRIVRTGTEAQSIGEVPMRPSGVSKGKCRK
jgi:hypothetical protein